MMNYLKMCINVLVNDVIDVLFDDVLFKDVLFEYV